MKLHHLNISCLDVNEALGKFINLFLFEEKGYLLSNENKHAAENASKIYLVAKGNISITLQKSENVLFDTIDDIAFNVDSVTQWCANVEKHGGVVVEKPHLVDCLQRPFTREQSIDGFQTFCNCGKSFCENYVEKAVVKSSIGNLRHTLLNKRRFKGIFLPGFVSSGCKQYINNYINLTNVDHVALAVHCGDIPRHIDWYKNCFKMSRYRTNVKETQSGLVIRSSNGKGLRLFTLAEHPCSEVSVTSGNEIEMRNDEVKFVFVESLNETGSDQVQTFLNHHRGPGVQHVAFYSNDITADAQCWKNFGVPFIKPPPAYYDEIASTLAKIRDTHDVDDISDVGILIDAEQQAEENGVHGYLYQIFTEPVFDTHTFFFELIQRDNARGFGSGNISALWRALDSHLHEKRITDGS